MAHPSPHRAGLAPEPSLLGTCPTASEESRGADGAASPRGWHPAPRLGLCQLTLQG